MDIYIGVDEVGRGALAGPIYAAAFAYPANVYGALDLYGLNDSKKLTEKSRKRISDTLWRDTHKVVSVVRRDANFIDSEGIAVANNVVLHEALHNVIHSYCIQFNPNVRDVHWIITIDGDDHGFQLNLDAPHTLRIEPRADAAYLDVMAASIIAKVARDEYMCDLAKEYPNYGFEKHKGYGTAAHLAAIRKYGPALPHRKSFAPMSRMK